MFKPGEVVSLYSDVAGKRKYHLCVSLGGHFLFLNSPKPRSYPADLQLPCSDFPFLTPTAQGLSIVSCNMVLVLTDHELRRRGAQSLGVVGKSVLIKIMDHVAQSEALSDEEREEVLSGLDGWV